MAELFIIGQIIGAKDFSKTHLFCKWSIHAGSGWKHVEGATEGQTQVDSPGYDDTVYWCHPIDTHYATKGIPGWPKIHVQVFHFDKFGRSEICGYGHIFVPTTPGTHKVECHVWKPIGKLSDRITEFFLGGGPMLKNPDIVYNGFERYRLCTQAMGSVLFELNLIHKDLKKYGVETY